MAVDPMELAEWLEVLVNPGDLVVGPHMMRAGLEEAAACIRVLVEWQPIETAPKDMTEVVVLIARKRIRLGWYFAPSSRTAGWRDENGKPIKPTHWTPLPLGGSDA